MHSRSGRVIFALTILAVSFLVVMLCSHNIMRHSERQSSNKGHPSIVSKPSPGEASQDLFAGDKNANVKLKRIRPEGSPHDQGVENNKINNTEEDNSPDGVANDEGMDEKNSNNTLIRDEAIHEVVKQEQAANELIYKEALNDSSPKRVLHDQNSVEMNIKEKLEDANPERMEHDQGALGIYEEDLLDNNSPEQVGHNQGAGMNNAMVTMEKIGHVLKITTLVYLIKADNSLTNQSNTVDKLVGGLQVNNSSLLGSAVTPAFDDFSAYINVGMENKPETNVPESLTTPHEILQSNRESPLSKTDENNAQVAMAKIGHSLKVTILMNGDTPIPNRTNRMLEQVSDTQVHDFISVKENKSESDDLAPANGTKDVMQGKTSSPTKESVEYTSANKEPPKTFLKIQTTENESETDNESKSEDLASVDSTYDVMQSRQSSPVNEAKEYTSSNTEPQKPFPNIQTTENKSERENDPFPARLKLYGLSEERSNTSSLHSSEQSQNIGHADGHLPSMLQEGRSANDEVDDVSKNITQSFITPIFNALAHPLDSIYKFFSGTYNFIKRIAKGLW